MFAPLGTRHTPVAELVQLEQDGGIDAVEGTTENVPEGARVDCNWELQDCNPTSALTLGCLLLKSKIKHTQRVVSHLGAWPKPVFVACLVALQPKTENWVAESCLLDSWECKVVGWPHHKVQPLGWLFHTRGLTQHCAALFPQHVTCLSSAKIESSTSMDGAFHSSSPLSHSKHRWV